MAWPNGVAKWRGLKLDGVAKQIMGWGVAIRSGHSRWSSEGVIRSGHWGGGWPFGVVIGVGGGHMEWPMEWPMAWP